MCSLKPQLLCPSFHIHISPRPQCALPSRNRGQRSSTTRSSRSRCLGRVAPVKQVCNDVVTRAEQHSLARDRALTIMVISRTLSERSDHIPSDSRFGFLHLSFLRLTASLFDRRLGLDPAGEPKSCSDATRHIRPRPQPLAGR